MRRLDFPLLLFAVMNTVAPCVSQQTITNANEIRSFYEAGLRKNGIIGSSLVLIRNGQVVLRDNYGLQNRSPDQPVADTTTYHWASVTKTFTGIAIMQLRDRGLLSLDDPLIKYIPELAAAHDPYGPISQGHHPPRHVTLRRLPRSPHGPGATQEWQPFEPTQWSQTRCHAALHRRGFSSPALASATPTSVSSFSAKSSSASPAIPYQLYMEKNILRPLGMDAHHTSTAAPISCCPTALTAGTSSAASSPKIHFDFNTGITRSNGGLKCAASRT